MQRKGIRSAVAGMMFALGSVLLTGAAGPQEAAQWWDVLPRSIYSTLERVEVDTGWFEVYRVSPGVTAIYEPGHFEEVISYLIEGDDLAVLFDSGLGIGNIKHVVDQLTERPVTVVNSHTHPDHVGGNPLFEEFAVFDSDFARERLANGRPDLSGLITEESVWMDLPAGFDRSTYHHPPMTATRYLREGDVLDLGGRNLEVLHTPGHTPAGICLLDRTNRLLFTGDTFYPSSLYAHTADADFDDYYRTAQRLGDLARAVDIVCPGHNEARTEAALLGRMARAFVAIRSGTAVSEAGRGGVRRYEFDGFAILTRSQP